MKPTLDEEIRRIAEECRERLRGGMPWDLDRLKIEAAIRAGIEAWKRQEPSLVMLQAALEWNRAEKPHNVVIGREYQVAQQMWKAMMLVSLRTSETTGEGE